MARYTGATCRISRRYGKDLDFKTLKSRSLESKCKFGTTPGQHGQRKGHRSDYGQQLAAKQMLRMQYGVLEKYFRKLYKTAASKKGVTGVILLQLLESRLDNVVYRMGFAGTRREARQLVSHRHILVNGEILNVPSYQVNVGDVISIREKARSHERITDALQWAQDKGFPEWVNVDAKEMSGTFKSIPERDDIPTDIDVSLIVELYSK